MEHSGWNGGQVSTGRGVSRNAARGREGVITGAHGGSRQQLIPTIPIFLRPPFVLSAVNYWCLFPTPFQERLSYVSQELRNVFQHNVPSPTFHR